MARIERFTTRTEAEMARGLLEAHGIAARVVADDAGGNRPDIAYGIGGTVVEVLDEDLHEALEVLDAPAGPIDEV